MDNIRYYTITELNRIIKKSFDKAEFFNRIYLKGEISNFKVQMPSGHCYFTIKDETSRVSAIMFKTTANKVGTNFKEGDKVNVIGKVTVYEASGTYQVYVDSMELSGSGDLYKKFLELKKKLGDEGLFDESHKRLIPRYPTRVGVVTASTGAAIRDVITTIKRRYPLCEIVLFESLVQGEKAANDIANKIEMANNYKDKIDTLIVGRGGGSIEDLWAFNEEVVARSIYNSKIPVISAVGHEVDFTISDFVADKRAATPTAAAELSVPNIMDISISLDNYYERCNNLINNKINNYKMLLNKIKSSSILINPINIYNVKKQILNVNVMKLDNIFNIYLNNKKLKLFKLEEKYVLKNPKLLYDKKINKLENNINKLELLNPLNSLKRGYAIIKKDNKCITSINEVKTKENIEINLKDGIIKASILEVK